LIAILVLETRQSPLPASLPAGEAIVLPPTGGDQHLQIQAPGQEAVDLGSNWPDAWEATLEPGPYRVFVQSVDGKTAEYGVGINAGDPVESDLRPRPWTQAAPTGQGQTPQMGSVLGLAEESGARPIELLPWLLGAALLALALEAVLAWR
jgi:hypothetical protein